MLLAGCAGTAFEWDRAKQIHVGTTQAEMVALLGKPYLVKTQGENQIWIWSYANGVTGQTGVVSYQITNGVVTAVPVIAN